MKRIGTALTIVVIIAGFAISCFIGQYVSDKSHTESRAAQFGWHTKFVIAQKFPQNSAICGIPLYMKKMCFSVKKMC